VRLIANVPLLFHLLAVPRIVVPLRTKDRTASCPIAIIDREKTYREHDIINRKERSLWETLE